MQAELSLSCWGDSVLSVIHLMNRLPSAVIKNVTSYEKLGGKKPNYHHLRTFACLAFASNPTRSGDNKVCI